MRLGLFIFALFAAAFSSITSLSLDGTIGQSGTADLVILADFANSTGEQVYLNLSGHPDSVIVKDKTGLVLAHQRAVSGNGTLIIVTVPLDHLRFEIKSDSFTMKEGSLWNFELTISSSENVSSLNASMAFPKGTMLKSTNGAVSGIGDSLAVSWKATGMKAGQLARMRAGYEITEAQALDAVPFAIGGLAILAILAAFYLSRPKPAPAQAPPSQTDKSMETNPVFKTLDEVDKEILREIARSEGKTTQATIYLNTHIAKATLSRRLASLEGRGIIKRSQKGNRNLVTLSEEMR